MESAAHKSINAAVTTLPSLLRPTAVHWFERLHESDGVQIPFDDFIVALTRFVACSEFAANTALKEWNWLVEHVDALNVPPDRQVLNEFVQGLATGSRSIDEIKQQFRQCRNRYMLHILWREVAGLADLRETLESLSALADELVDAASVFAHRQSTERFGVVRDASGEAVSIVTLGMGKLGGTELNFSSDIDLIFLYPGGSDSDGVRCLSAQEYFTRVSRQIIALLDEHTADGFVFRVDTRLRPFGESGPPVASFAALESYLLQHGRGWERYAYVKARIIGTAPSPEVVHDLYDNLISPFVYRRYLDFGIFESLRGMHALIATEVKRRELAANIKLGPGGIREIEFIVQSLQLVRGGSDRDVQSRELQNVLPILIGRRGLRAEAAIELQAAYEFLRRLENFIQGIRDQQTHDLPVDAMDQARLCLAMNYADWEALHADVDRHRSNVTRLFEEIAFRGQTDGENPDEGERFRNLWNENAAVDQWAEQLRSAEFSEAEEIADQLVTFSNAATTRKIDLSSRQRLRTFMPALLLLIKSSDRPARSLRRTLAIIEKILRRSAYLALLNENQQALSRLVSLCERSAYIADQIARYPVLLDELLEPRIQAAIFSRDEFQNELSQRLGRGADSESQIEQLGEFQRANMFHIAVADFTGNLPIMKVSDALTELAAVILEHALQVAWHDMTARHGVPMYVLDGAPREAGFGIVAYGKLGGIELSYRSDLDLVFLHNSRGTAQITNGDKPIENAMFFARLVRRLVLILTSQTGSGLLYEIDMRLRPDGHSGLLVTSTDAFERYQIENAWTWEHQALLRARAVAGSVVVAEEFERVRTETLTGRVRRDTLSQDVVSMRQRMRKELDKSDASKFDLKQGRGGISDIEFIVQYLVLKCAREHASVIEYTDNIRQLDALAAIGAVEGHDAARIQDIYREYRLRLHRMTLDDAPQLMDNDQFVAERECIGKIWDAQLARNKES
jgi:glutamate-ammonia-ligase adenylyltransferase